MIVTLGQCYKTFYQGYLLPFYGIYVIFVSTLLQITVIITVLLKEGGFFQLNFNFNVIRISNQSFYDASSSNITRLPIPMPMACQDQEKTIKNKNSINYSMS
jgi:hypothetical protein